MAYKDKERQKQAQRERTRRYRLRQQGVTSEGVTLEGVTGVKARPNMQATEVQHLVQQSIPNYGQADCQCMHCRQARGNGKSHVINHGPYKAANRLADREINRVILPGDPDYAGVADLHPEWPRREL